ncbi:retroviral-like aspartic protease family protein [candidate division KSB1 bacterium]|nr:retroviral-like aspartic protease family protein [candidate division KSB1 bacterium]MBL7095618.1 retroviral-like aspartic protease family protein [candidate division KSB1 bacterium]
MVKYGFDVNSPIIQLKAKIEGLDSLRTLNTVLDTGATYMMIPWEIADILGYEPELSKKRINITTASGVEKVPLIILMSVSVLGKKTENVKAIVHDLPARSYVDGLLGLSFFKNIRFCLDFREGFLEIE